MIAARAQRSDHPAAASLRTLLVLTLTAAVLWHGMTVARTVGTAGNTGRDFATLHFAAKAALAGQDPYDRAALSKLAIAERSGTRTVTALRTPPPSVAVGLWSAWLPLPAAWQVFVGLQELALALSIGVMWRWSRPLGPAAGVLAVVVFSVSSAVPLALQAGRGHLLLLAIGLLAAWLHAEGRRTAPGLLIGLGAAVNPVLAVAAVPWVVQRQWRAVGLALAGFVGAHLAIAPLVGPDTIVHYWTDVAPDLLRGDWTGAATRIDAVENHAIVGAFVSGRRVPLAWAMAQLLAGAALLTLLGWLYRRPSTDPLVGIARLSSLFVAALLVTTITLDQHLVLALPALAGAAAAVAYGRLDRRWAVPVGFTAAILLYPTKPITELVRVVLAPTLPSLGLAVAETTTLALCLLLVVAARIGAHREL